MIQAIINSDNRVIISELPKVGDTISVEHFGPALVESIFHDDRDNFIRLEFQETLIGRFSQDHRLTIIS